MLFFYSSTLERGSRNAVVVVVGVHTLHFFQILHDFRLFSRTVKTSYNKNKSTRIRGHLYGEIECIDLSSDIHNTIHTEAEKTTPSLRSVSWVSLLYSSSHRRFSKSTYIQYVYNTYVRTLQYAPRRGAQRPIFFSLFFKLGVPRDEKNCL